MPKKSIAIECLPPSVLLQLQQLGENLAIARKRRRETRRVWTRRVGVSEPTLMRMEKGDPSVALGSYASALWLIGRAQALPDLAAPQLDEGALESEVRAARVRSVRKPVSIDARLREGLG